MFGLVRSFGPNLHKDLAYVRNLRLINVNRRDSMCIAARELRRASDQPVYLTVGHLSPSQLVDIHVWHYSCG